MPRLAANPAAGNAAADSPSPSPSRAVPPGWEENPTSFSRRALLAALAGVGFVVALYLALYRWRAWSNVWDPFFDSRQVFDSTAPVPDALAGVLAYGAELVLLWGRAASVSAMSVGGASA